MRDTFVKTFLEISRKDKNVLLVTGDLGFGVLNDIWKEIPNQIINVGIAEQNMIGFASGLAKSGKTVYVYSIANFPSLRPLEQIRNDAAYHNLNVKIVSVGEGFSYGSLGMTHHATEDVAIIRAIPNIRIYSPFSDEDATFTINESYILNGPAYIRISRTSVKHNINFSNNLKRGVPLLISNKSNIAIIANGNIVEEVLLAYEKLKLSNQKVDVLLFHTLKPIETIELSLLLKNYNKIFVVQEQTIYGGLSSIIKDSLLPGYPSNIYTIGINDRFTSEVGDASYLRKINKLDSNSIIDFIHNEK
jgi:transketolase